MSHCRSYKSFSTDLCGKCDSPNAVQIMWAIQPNQRTLTNCYIYYSRGKETLNAFTNTSFPESAVGFDSYHHTLIMLTLMLSLDFVMTCSLNYYTIFTQILLDSNIFQLS